MNIIHVIPQVGYQELTLYDPAVSIYQRLKQKKELNRLNKLRHLGAYAYVLQGARLARWDYSVAMLYYSTNFKISRMQGNFKIGEIDFTSGISALQALSLIWNIGHLPGTFAVEKGVCRYLSHKSSKSPVKQLNWRFSEMAEVKRIIKKANALFLKDDYLALSRILCI
jgi:HD superfamily phosphohydrolase